MTSDHLESFIILFKKEKKKNLKEKKKKKLKFTADIFIIQ